jgi:SPP1 gp7 family putative phage head morphogenesis protein
MQKLKDEYYLDIEREIMLYFERTYYKPIFELMQMEIYNSKDVLLDAIRTGKLLYKDGEFIGKTNMAMSRELSKFAKYDKKSGKWKGQPPINLKVAIIDANAKSDKLHKDIDTKLAKLADQLDNPQLGFIGIDNAAEGIDQQVKDDLGKLGIDVNLNPETKKRLVKDYVKNQNMNIQNWQGEQIERLRKAVMDNMTGEGSMSRMNLIDRIKLEFEVSHNKARFLARQETSIFMSRLGIDRAKDSGVKKYKWSTSHDIDVRDSHRALQGKVVDFNNPPVVDEKTQRRAHAGEDYNCRCAKIWVLD